MLTLVLMATRNSNYAHFNYVLGPTSERCSLFTKVVVHIFSTRRPVESFLKTLGLTIFFGPDVRKNEGFEEHLHENGGKRVETVLTSRESKSWEQASTYLFPQMNGAGMRNTLRGHLPCRFYLFLT